MIDITKQYTTRDGLPVRILCVDADHPEYPVVGILNGRATDWTKTGKYSHNDSLQSNADLIEGKPKAQVKLWGVMYRYDREDKVHVEWFDAEKDCFLPYSNSVTVLARAIPFKWEEP